MTVFDERLLPSLGRDGRILPEGWAEVSLQEIVVHALGGEWGEGEAAPGLVEVGVVRGTEFREWARDKGSTAAVRWIKKVSLEKRRLETGDIVVEISGGGPEQPVGRTLRIDEEALRRAGRPLICSNFCRQMRIHPAIDPAFVQLGLSEKYLRGEVNEYQTQTTNLRNLNFTDFLAGTVLRLPPLSEQRRIVATAAELLARVQAVGERLARVRPILKRFRQAVLAAAGSGKLTEEWREKNPVAEAFESTLERVIEERRKSFESLCRQAELAGRRPPKVPAILARGEWQAPSPLEPPEIPEGWTLVPLRGVIEILQYGTSVRAEKDMKGGVPVLRMGNIKDGEIDLSDLKWIDPRAEDVAAYRLKRGDILFNRTNSPELVGKAAVFDADLDAVFASYLVRLTCDERLVSSRYVCYWINSPWGRQWSRAVRTDCVSQSNINGSKLLTMPLPAPPLAEQHEIVRRVEALFQLADAIERRLAAATAEVEALPLAVLDRAFRGELIPTEAELADEEGRDYETAAALLERVSAASKEERPHLEGLPAEPIPPCPLAIPVSGWVAPGERPPEEVLAAFRQVCWGAEPMTENELLRRVALRLGGSRLTKSLRSRLQELLELALERRIVAREGDLYMGATPKLGRYDDEFLLDTLRAVLKEGDELDRRTLTRSVAAYLGYSQVTAAMRDRMDEVFEEGIRRGLLGAKGGRIYFIHSNSS